MKLAQQIKIRFDEKYKIGSTPWVRTEDFYFIKKFTARVKKELASPKLLDIGCGNGWLSVYFAKNGIEVEGVDSSKEAIKVARMEARKLRLKNVQFKVGDALDFPYKKNQFDIVFDRGLLHHQPQSEWKRYLKGLQKVLKPNGLFYLAVFSDTMGKSGSALNKRLWHKSKDRKTGYWTYDHYFNEALIDQIFGKLFQIIAKEKEKKNRFKRPSLLLYFILRKKP